MKNESQNVTEVETKAKPSIIPTPREDVTGRKPIKLNFHVGKEFYRSFDIPQADARKKAVTVIHMYPTLGEWIGRTAPDGVNPRSHEPECLKSPVAKRIEQTIHEKPEDFFLANRGSTLIADSVEFDDKSGNVEIIINDAENQGLADGATTDAVIAKVQTAYARETLNKKDASYLDVAIPEMLKNGRLHLEVITGIDDRDRLAHLVEGRNTSRQVKGWSIADFRGSFDWIKKVLDEGKFAGRIGYEENSTEDVNILDVLSYLTLFHVEFDGQDEFGSDKAPTVAYSNKGRIASRLDDNNLLKGYKALQPIIQDILTLHDYIYAGFEKAYDAAYKGKSRLGRRRGVESRLLDKPYKLPLTGTESSYVIPSGFIYPILASFRALVSYKGKTHWKRNPFEHWDKFGSKLVAELFDQVDEMGGNPNAIGKHRLIYVALHKAMRLTLAR